MKSGNWERWSTSCVWKLQNHKTHESTKEVDQSHSGGVVKWSTMRLSDCIVIIVGCYRIGSGSKIILPGALLVHSHLQIPLLLVATSRTSSITIARCHYNKERRPLEVLTTTIKGEGKGGRHCRVVVKTPNSVVTTTNRWWSTSLMVWFLEWLVIEMCDNHNKQRI